MAFKNWKISARAKRSDRRFLSNNKGSVAVTFGLAFPAVAFLSLVVVDYSRASSAKQALQETLDASALIVARSTAVTADAVDTVGDKAFTAQLPANMGLTGVTPNESGRITNVSFTPDGTKVIGSASASVTPLVASVFLNGPITISANSEVVRSVNKLEIALVLDTTGSMQGSKITNLISAAKTFVTAMETAASKSTEVNPIKIAVVPFSTTVKVQAALSMASYNNTSHSMSGLPTWLDGRGRSIAYNNDIFNNTSDATRADRFNILKAVGKSWGGCVEARVAPNDIRDVAINTSDPTTLYTPFFWPDEYDDGTGTTNTNGYLNDYLADGTSGGSSAWKARTLYAAKYNTTTWKSGAGSGGFLPNSAYAVANWQYGPNAACDMQSVKRLSTGFSAIRTHIDGLVASGETNIPLGLMWGWHSISPTGPFGDGVAYSTPNTTKIIVLMTDGDNTMNTPVNSNNLSGSYYHGYGFAWQGRLSGINGSSSASARTTALNDRMVPPAGSPNAESLCGNIKGQNITIYTVGVGVTSASQTLLTKCATAADYYYDVDAQGANLSTTFSAIAGRIENLRISH